MKSALRSRSACRVVLRIAGEHTPRSDDDVFDVALSSANRYGMQNTPRLSELRQPTPDFLFVVRTDPECSLVRTDPKHPRHNGLV